MFIVKVKKEKCKACGLCLDVCPVKIFKYSKGFNRMGLHYIEVDKENKNLCTGCCKCVILCPDAAIEIYTKEGKE